MQCGKILRRATIFVRDAEAAASFYMAVFGFTVYSDQSITLRQSSPVNIGDATRPQPARFITVKGNHPFTGMIGLIAIEGEAEDKLANGKLGIGSVVLVLEAEEIDAAIRRVPAAGGEIVVDLHNSTNTAGENGEKIPSRRFFAKDPDGYLLEVFEPV